MNGNKQSLAFIEPHGLQHEGPGHKKISFHETIKEIEDRIANANVSLSSFVITPTRHAKLNWGLTVDQLNEMNVFFMEEQAEDYKSHIFDRLFSSGVLEAT